MKADENEFFRQATLRICGHLQIEVALLECLKYLETVIPADSIFLSVWEPDISSLRVIARTNTFEGEKTDILIQLTKKAKTSIEKLYTGFKISTWPDAVIINDPRADPITKDLTRQLKEEDSSLLHMPLETVGRPLCSILVKVEGKKKYSENHARMLSLLKEPLSIAMSNALEHREILKLKELLVDDNRFLHRQLLQISGEQIIGADYGLKKVLNMVRQVAAHDSPVLLLGETGVGKDVIANAIHYSSLRSSGPFVSVNCGAIPDSLIDSELFGHEKGAFTGALFQKRGRFERANKGTIFLDEIGELPLQAQVRLLRVLQSKEIERVGGTKTISLDIRIIAATNRNLQEMVTTKQFREDLWFRLDVFPIWIPPLRERKSDIPALLQHFINLKSRELKLPRIPVLAQGAIDPLMKYDWPGNIRELANVVERALITNDDGPLDFKNVQLRGVNLTNTEQNKNPDGLNKVISAHIQQVLAKTNGKVHGPGGAAELLEINPNTLRNRMDKLGIAYGKK